MGKVITVDPSQAPPESRVWVQKWLFSTREPFMTKTVDEKEVPIEDYTEVTAAHIETYLENNVKKNVRTFRKQADIKTIEAETADIELET